MLDHDTDAYYKISRAFTGGQPYGGLTGDHVLDNITLYWLTGTGTSAARAYWEVGRAAARAAGQAPPARSSRPRAAGSRRPTPPSATSTKPPRAATLLPRKSPSCSRPRSGPRSGRCDSTSRTRCASTRSRQAESGAARQRITGLPVVCRMARPAASCRDRPLILIPYQTVTDDNRGVGLAVRLRAR
jgi:hypothetical protein